MSGLANREQVERCCRRQMSADVYQSIICIEPCIIQFPSNPSKQTLKWLVLTPQDLWITENNPKVLTLLTSLADIEDICTSLESVDYLHHATSQVSLHVRRPLSQKERKRGKEGKHGGKGTLAHSMSSPSMMTARLTPRASSSTSSPRPSIDFSAGLKSRSSPSPSRKFKPMDKTRRTSSPSPIATEPNRSPRWKRKLMAIKPGASVLGISSPPESPVDAHQRLSPSADTASEQMLLKVPRPRLESGGSDDGCAVPDECFGDDPASSQDDERASCTAARSPCSCHALVDLYKVSTMVETSAFPTLLENAYTASVLQTTAQFQKRGDAQSAIPTPGKQLHHQHQHDDDASAGTSGLAPYSRETMFKWAPAFIVSSPGSEERNGLLDFLIGALETSLTLRRSFWSHPDVLEHIRRSIEVAQAPFQSKSTTASRRGSLSPATQRRGSSSPAHTTAPETTSTFAAVEDVVALLDMLVKASRGAASDPDTMATIVEHGACDILVDICSFCMRLRWAELALLGDQDLVPQVQKDLSYGCFELLYNIIELFQTIPALRLHTTSKAASNAITLASAASLHGSSSSLLVPPPTSARAATRPVSASPTLVPTVQRLWVILSNEMDTRDTVVLSRITSFIARVVTSKVALTSRPVPTCRCYRMINVLSSLLAIPCPLTDLVKEKFASDLLDALANSEHINPHFHIHSLLSTSMDTLSDQLHALMH
eukprot:m.309458 g.309458  ORF g.309458 m.309458 type:complete len:714 (+) comp15945_c11_seq1:144-2285(+)